MDNPLQTLQEIDESDTAKLVICSLDDLSNHILAREAGVNVITQNIRSIYNFNDFEITFSQFKLEVDIIILTECRLSPNKSIPYLSNYTSYFTAMLQQNDGIVVPIYKKRSSRQSKRNYVNSRILFTNYVSRLYNIRYLSFPFQCR